MKMWQFCLIIGSIYTANAKESLFNSVTGAVFALLCLVSIFIGE